MDATFQNILKYIVFPLVIISILSVVAWFVFFILLYLIMLTLVCVSIIVIIFGIFLVGYGIIEREEYQRLDSPDDPYTDMYFNEVKNENR